MRVINDYGEIQIAVEAPQHRTNLTTVSAIYVLLSSGNKS